MAKQNNNQQNNGCKKIKISHAKLNLELEPAVRIIGDFSDITDIDTTMNIVKTRKNLDEAVNVFLKARKKLVEDLAEKDESGRPKTKKATHKNPLTGENQEVDILVYKNDETQAEANKKARELDAKEITVEIHPIYYINIKECKGLTPNLIVASGEFIEF